MIHGLKKHKRKLTLGLRTLEAKRENYRHLVSRNQKFYNIDGDVISYKDLLFMLQLTEEHIENVERKKRELGAEIKQRQKKKK